ncbi:MAG: DUF4389 domain-containing protein [bacterium]
MKFEIQHQDKYSRSELLLRTFFGTFYIGIPHLFLLMFIWIWGQLITFIAWFAILFTGKYPEELFEQIVGYYRWSFRLTASLTGLFDGYPAFGLEQQEGDKIILEVPYPSQISRSQLILTWLFGIFYIGIPHGIILFFVSIWVSILSFLAWFVVLFTGQYPKEWHESIVNYYRWSLRVNLYYLCLTPDYPPFTGKRDSDIA